MGKRRSKRGLQGLVWGRNTPFFEMSKLSFKQLTLISIIGLLLLLLVLVLMMLLGGSAPILILLFPPERTQLAASAGYFFFNFIFLLLFPLVDDWELLMLMVFFRTRFLFFFSLFFTFALNESQRETRYEKHTKKKNQNQATGEKRGEARMKRDDNRLATSDFLYPPPGGEILITSFLSSVSLYSATKLTSLTCSLFLTHFPASVIGFPRQHMTICHCEWFSLPSAYHSVSLIRKWRLFKQLR